VRDGLLRAVRVPRGRLQDFLSCVAFASSGPRVRVIYGRTILAQLLSCRSRLHPSCGWSPRLCGLSSSAERKTKVR
jgi:hypothetical protein